MNRLIYVYKISVDDLPWIKEAVLALNEDLYEYAWAEAYVRMASTYIALRTASAYIELTSHPYWEESKHLNTAEEFKEKLYEHLLTA